MHPPFVKTGHGNWTAWWTQHRMGRTMLVPEPVPRSILFPRVLDMVPACDETTGPRWDIPNLSKRDESCKQMPR